MGPKSGPGKADNMQDIFSMLKNMNPKELSDAAAKARAFVNTPEGRETLKKLKEGKPIEGLPISTDRQAKLMEELAKNPQAAKQLASVLSKG